MIKEFSPKSNIQKIRRFVYIFVIVAGLFNIIFPYTVSADMFNNDTQDVYVVITENVKESNDLLRKAYQFCQVSPYTIINNTAYMVSGNAGVATAIHSACQTLALVIATLLLMVDFFKKSISFEWSSRWENILLFLIKIVVVKVVITNVDTIVGYIYSAFNSVNTAATGGTLDFLPYGTAKTYKITIKESLVKNMMDQGLVKGWTSFFEDWGAGGFLSAPRKTFDYVISEDAVRIFYPNAPAFPAAGPTLLDYENHPFGVPVSTIPFNSTLEIVFFQVYFIVMKAIAYIIFVIAIGRIFELCVYMLFAPLPMATFASDTSNDVGKQFIKNFCGTILQISVMVVMFIIYVAATKYINYAFPNTPFISVVTLISLGLGVMKSGTWAKKICGTS